MKHQQIQIWIENVQLAQRGAVAGTNRYRSLTGLTSSSSLLLSTT